MPGNIYLWLFQRRHFQRPLALHIFSVLSVKYKLLKNLTQMLCHKIVHMMFHHKHKYFVLRILQISV